MSYYGGLGPAITGTRWTFFSIATMLLILRTYTYFSIVNEKACGWALMWASVAYVCAQSQCGTLACDETHPVQVLALCSIVLFTLCAAYGLRIHLSRVESSPRLPDAMLYD